jgi:uncharacterized membrane protein YeaQ/YmgE (transglycosylase-associated protein family)
MGIFSWLIFGIIAGSIAKFFLPKVPGGLVGLTLLGIIGSLLGGWFSTLLGFGGISGFDLRSFVIAILGTISTLWLYVYVTGRITSASISSPRQPTNAPHRRPSKQPITKPIAKRPAQRKILFISYRRADSLDVTGRLYDRLEARFGREHLFKDVDSIPLGVDFRQHIERMVTDCSAMVVVIGQRWLGQEESGTKFRTRIEDPNDFVRIEVETALKRDIPIVPILVQGATIPAEEALPSSLRDLRYRNGIPLRPDPDFHRDIQRLISALETHLK